VGILCVRVETGAIVVLLVDLVLSEDPYRTILSTNYREPVDRGRDWSRLYPSLINSLALEY
jgi:hypothetical protein